MISQITAEIKNHFPRSGEYGKYVIAPASASSTITGHFADTYLVGQYIYIKGSVLNDGVYQLTTVATGVLTVGEVLQAETTPDDIWVYGLSMPKPFLDLVAEIEAYQLANSGKDGIASESIGRYSVSFKNGGGWREVFKGKLDVYRCIYDSTDRFYESCRNWQNRMWP